MRIDRSIFLFAGIGLFCIAMSGIFYTRLSFPDNSDVSIIAKVLFFDRFFIEAFAISMLGLWILRFNQWWRYCFYGLFFLYYCVTTIQVYTFYLGGEYLTRLAVENINHISLLVNTQTIVLIAFTFSAFILFVFVSEISVETRLRSPEILILSLSILTICVTFIYSSKWLPSNIHVARQNIAKENFIEYTSPLSSYYQTFFGKGKSALQNKFQGLLPSEKFFLAKQGYTFDQNATYPLLKDFIYKGPLAIGDTQRTSQPNIIVFFSEGLSTNLTNVYEPDLPKITPHLLDFSKSSMRVENYYGHTYATYRGLLGQLCSIYPYYGGYGGWHSYYDKIVKPPYNSLNGVLKSEGYHTIFLDTHIHDKAYIDEMMGHIGFDEIVTGDQLSSRYLNNEKPLRDDSVSDMQFYRSFVQYLKKREADQEKPFFIGIYTLGTHAFRDMADDGKKFADGSNRVLNRIYSLDEAFGVFWDYFKQSILSQNTIVIFTSDHAPYMEKPYLAALEKIGTTTPKPSFLDTIPLIIFDPTRELPESYDAKTRTSIDFAPSLLHYLGIANRKNSFIGESIFEINQNRMRQYGIVSAGHLIVIDSNGSYFTLKDSKGMESTVNLFNKYVKGVKHYEMKRRIWSVDFPQ